MPKVTSDPKDRIIKARLNEDMSKWVDRQCEKYHLTVTEYIRRAMDCERKMENSKISPNKKSDSMAEKKFSATKEQQVAYLKEAAQYVMDNAEDLVGQSHRVSAFDVIISMSIDELPCVRLQRTCETAGWNTIRKWDGFGDSDTDSEGRGR